MTDYDCVHGPDFEVSTSTMRGELGIDGTYEYERDYKRDCFEKSTIVSANDNDMPVAMAIAA